MILCCHYISYILINKDLIKRLLLYCCYKFLVKISLVIFGLAVMEKYTEIKRGKRFAFGT